MTLVFRRAVELPYLLLRIGLDEQRFEGLHDGLGGGQWPVNAVNVWRFGFET